MWKSARGSWPSLSSPRPPLSPSPWGSPSKAQSAPRPPEPPARLTLYATRPPASSPVRRGGRREAGTVSGTAVELEAEADGAGGVGEGDEAELGGHHGARQLSQHRRERVHVPFQQLQQGMCTYSPCPSRTFLHFVSHQWSICLWDFNFGGVILRRPLLASFDLPMECSSRFPHLENFAFP